MNQLDQTVIASKASNQTKPRQQTLSLGCSASLAVTAVDRAPLPSTNSNRRAPRPCKRRTLTYSLRPSTFGCFGYCSRADRHPRPRRFLAEGHGSWRLRSAREWERRLAKGSRPFASGHHVNNQDKLVGYHRWDLGGPRDDVVVIANFANRCFFPYKACLPRGGVWRIASTAIGAATARRSRISAASIFSRQENFNDMPFSGTVGIGPYTALVLSQDA